MKKSIAVSLAALLTGCASYQASALNTLSSDVVQTKTTEGKKHEVAIAAKAFNKADCKRYLDRDVISEGYQPVQLYIENDSDNSYAFSLNRIDVPVADYEEVAHKVHTSTVGRAVGYGVGGLILWPLFIPAVIDGFKSAQANEELDRDFSAKVARDEVVGPHSHINRLLFVPKKGYKSAFTVTLLDRTHNATKTIDVTVN